MAGEDWMSKPLLNEDLLKEAYRFDFFQALRLIDSQNPHKPRLGTGIKAVDDPVRLTQPPLLDFSPTTLGSYSLSDRENAVPKLAVHFMGLFGPNGALPLHLTDYARDRVRHYHDDTLVDFANIFHHRMLSLFYRAWANARPAVSFDRPESDRFGFYVGNLLGIGTPAFRDRDALVDRAKLFYAASFAGQSKHPEGLRSIISDILDMPARIAEFVGEWMPIQTRDRTQLGKSIGLAGLGVSVVLGERVWSCQHKFRILLGALTRQQYLGMLPGSSHLPKLVAIVRNYLGDEYVWDVQLILQHAEVPAELALGKPVDQKPDSLNGEARLGWSMWLGPRHVNRDANDLMLNPFIQFNE